MRLFGDSVQNQFGLLTLAPPGTSGVPLTVNGVSGSNAISVQGSTSGTSLGISVAAGSSSSDSALSLASATSASGLMKVYGDGGVTIGTFAGTTDYGAGTLNVQNGLFIGGYPLYAGAPSSVVGNYTTVLSDANKAFLHNDGSARTFTINVALAYQAGTMFTIGSYPGAGTTTIALSSGTMVFSPSGATSISRSLAAGGLCTVINLAGFWFIAGNGLT